MTKKLKKLSRFDAVVIEDMGYVQQSREEMEVLFAFLADRYGRVLKNFGYCYDDFTDSSKKH